MNRATGSLLLLAGMLMALLWLTPDVPLLGFAALLLAIALRAPAGIVAPLAGIHRWAAVLALLLLLALLFLLAAWFALDPLTQQATQLVQDLPQSIGLLRDRIAETAFGAWLVPRLRLDTLIDGGTAVTQAAAAASGTLGALGDAALVLLIGVYLALSPQVYLRGLRLLTHPSVDAPVREAFAECGAVLRGWLLGQGFAMLVSGLLTWIGLLLIGVPLAGVLALIAAILGFIPVIGPVIAAVPAMLLAVTQSPMLALYVALLFFAIQFIEGNILTPMVQSEAANLPPALLLLAQILLGAWYGLLGLALAAPLAAAALVLVRRAYVEGWLGRPGGDGAREAARAASE